MAGVRIFDAALGGLGGCPFIPRATGNIASEDLVSMLHEMGIETGLDPEEVIGAARDVIFRQTPEPGRMALSDFTDVKRNGKIAMKLPEGVDLVNARIASHVGT